MSCHPGWTSTPGVDAAYGSSGVNQMWGSGHVDLVGREFESVATPWFAVFFPFSTERFWMVLCANRADCKVLLSLVETGMRGVGHGMIWFFFN